jgi:hypothetical protein
VTSPPSGGGGGSIQIVQTAPAPPSPVPPGAYTRPKGGGSAGGGGGQSGGGGAPPGGGGAPSGGGPSKGGKGKGKGTKPSAWSRLNNSGPGWNKFKPTSPARVPTRVADAGGFLSGLAVYTVVIIYVRYGPKGWLGWLSAKFLNKPMSASATGALGTTPKTKSGGTAAV